MLENIQISKVLFVDLETVSATADFENLDDRLRDHWRKKSRFVLRVAAGEELSDDMIIKSYEEKAAIYAEFGKIICISVGYIHSNSKELRLKSFASDNEKDLLSDFADLLHQHYSDPNEHLLCGHNIKEFDIPYLCRRMIINSVALPAMLKLSGKKPWEAKHLIDTMELWKFGDIKNYTSLDLLAAVLEVDTPKDDIDGSQVGPIFWKEGDLQRIVSYCEKDVLTVAQILLRLKGLPLLTEQQIVSV